MANSSKRNQQFRFQIFSILFDEAEMNTKEIYSEFVARNPKSCPSFGRMCQMMRSKWFVNTGTTTSRANGANRYAIWELSQEFRQYPPIRHPRSSKLMHTGGRENYEVADEVAVDSCSSY